MDTLDTIKKLRHKKSLNMFDRKENLFTKIQLNKKEKFVCWQRFVSKDKCNWINWNDYLSLKDVLNIQSKIISNNTH